MARTWTRIWTTLWLGAGAVACTGSPYAFDGPTQAIRGEDGLVYVGDGYYHARIAVFDREGRFVREWGSRGFAEGQLQNPHGMALRGRDRVIVADRDNARIQVFDTRGTLRDVWAPQSLGRPWSVALAPDGALFAVDGGDQTPEAPRAGIVELDSKGRVVQRFGHHGSAPGELSEPHMIALSAARNVFVVELGNRRVQKFKPEAECEPEIGRCSYAVAPDWPSLPKDASFDPLSIAADGGRVYVGHQGPGPQIWVFDEDSGELLERLGNDLVERPHGLSVDADGGLWIADDRGDRVVRTDPAGAVTLTLGE